MPWRIWGRVLDTTHLSSSVAVYQKIIPPDDIVVKNMQTWFHLYNSPTFTNLYFTIYSLSGTTPKKLLYTSTNVLTKTEIMTLNYAIKGLRFDFNDVVLKGSETYAFVPRGTSYAFASNAYIEWKLGYPDPAYRLNVPLTNVGNAGRSPYDVSGFIGADL